MGTLNQKTRDEIGQGTSGYPVVAIRKEVINAQEGPTIAETNTIGNSWIVGSSTNGIVGTNTATQGGGQQVVGASGRTATIYSVTNPNKTFYEYYNFDKLIDLTNTTATVNTASGVITFTTGQELVSDYIYLYTNTAASATLSATYTGGLNFYVSTDGGTSWHYIVEDVKDIFGDGLVFPLTFPFVFPGAQKGTSIKYKAEATTATTLNSLKIIYETEE